MGGVGDILWEGWSNVSLLLYQVQTLIYCANQLHRFIHYKFRISKTTISRQQFINFSSEVYIEATLQCFWRYIVVSEDLTAVITTSSE